MSKLAQAGDSSTVSPRAATPGRGRDRVLERARERDLAAVRQRRLDQPGVAPDQHGVAHLAAAGRRERREILALAVAARDQHERTVEAGDRRLGRADVGALRVVDPADAAAARPRAASGAAGPRSGAARRSSPRREFRRRCRSRAPRAHWPRCGGRAGAAPPTGSSGTSPAASQSSPSCASRRKSASWRAQAEADPALARAAACGRRPRRRG